jgi:RimJ/RimL family protein N-acetyltransferase
MPFELQPVLRGNWVELRPLRPEHWAALYAAASDPLIWELHPIRDRYKEKRFREFFQTGLDSGGAFAVLDTRGGSIIGSTRYHGCDPEKSEIEIGWTFLARAYWGGLYNGEMKRLMLDHAFRFVRSVIFRVGPENFRSRRAVEKLGAVETGLQDADGRQHVVYRIARPDAAEPG